MAVKRTLTSKFKATPLRDSVQAPQKDEEEVIALEKDVRGATGNSALKTTKKYCYFCQKKEEPKYFDAQALRKFVSDRGRIVPRARSGACSKHQRRVATHIKYARHLSLLPFKVSI